MKKKSNVERVTYNTLETLLGGIYEAIVNAQKTVSVASMDIWRNQHFNKDDSPKTIKFQLPSGTHEVPTAILVNDSNIGIKDVEFELEMRIDIDEEIEKDLGKHRILDWSDVKLIAVKRGWLRSALEMGLGDGIGREGVYENDKYRLLCSNQKNYSVWKPDVDWSDTQLVITDPTPDLRNNKAFRFWLDVNDYDPSEWGLGTNLNKRTITADSSARGEGNMAKIKVTFEGKDAPEGIARLNDVYVKMIPST